MADRTDPKNRINRRQILKIGAAGTVSVAATLLGGGVGYGLGNGAKPVTTLGECECEEDIVQLQEKIGDMTELGATPRNLVKTLSERSLNVKDFGAIGNATTGDQAVIQQALDFARNRSIEHVVFPSGVYYVDAGSTSDGNSGGIELHDNVTIHMQADTVIQGLASSATHSNIFRAKNKKNIKILGGIIKGDRMTHLGTTGEWGHGINILGCEHVTIAGTCIMDCWGDGIYLGSDPLTNAPAKQVRLIQVKCSNNRRQGLSVTSIDGLYAEYCTFSESNGTSPQCGVDLEPNTKFGMLKHVVFMNCRADNNELVGFLVQLSRLDATSERVDIQFVNCRTSGNKYGYCIQYCNDHVKGSVKFVDCTATNELWNGFLETSCSSLGVETVYRGCAAYACNTENNTANTGAFGASFFIREDSRQPRTTIGNAIYEACLSVEDRSTPVIRRGFAISTAYAAIPRHVKYVNCESRGESISMFEIIPTAENIVAKHDVWKEIDSTANTTVKTRHLGFTHTNRGASGEIRLTLPPAKENYTFQFRVEQGHYLNIAPHSGGQILGLTAAADTELRSQAIGASLALRGRTDGNWEVTRVVGVWEEV
jgi:hypothetical protein